MIIMKKAFIYKPGFAVMGELGIFNGENPRR